MKKRMPKVAGWLKKAARCSREDAAYLRDVLARTVSKRDEARMESESWKLTAESLENDCMVRDETIDRLRLERDEAKKEAECFKVLDSQANRLIESLKTKLATEKHDTKYWEDACSQSNKDHTKKIGEMRDEIENLKAKLAASESCGDSNRADARRWEEWYVKSENEKNGLMAELSQAVSSRNELKAKLDALHVNSRNSSKYSDAKIASLENELAETKAKLAASESRIKNNSRADIAENSFLLLHKLIGNAWEHAYNAKTAMDAEKVESRGPGSSDSSFKVGDKVFSKHPSSTAVGIVKEVNENISAKFRYKVAWRANVDSEVDRWEDWHTESSLGLSREQCG